MHTRTLASEINKAKKSLQNLSTDPGEAENLKSFFFLLKKAENLESFFTLVVKPENLDLILGPDKKEVVVVNERTNVGRNTAPLSRLYPKRAAAAMSDKHQSELCVAAAVSKSATATAMTFFDIPFNITLFFQSSDIPGDLIPNIAKFISFTNRLRLQSVWYSTLRFKCALIVLLLS
ncbi:hypothetical protein M5K25_002565 [Dendrobium thyrsiflorum]|uniref:Uncharacterized protein n=1 Tax=Dendrobium thyrsiflorum TaxID=117978 RepID=A0ABD0VN32_DENTH